jgi:hypothetical protein
MRYRVADAFEYALNCHCSNCRRATGSAFKPIAGIARSCLTLTNGAEAVLVFESPSGDWTSEHCGICGSLLYAVIRGGTFLHLAMGTLVDTPSIEPSAHVFVDSKAPWFTIADGLPQHARAMTEP